jgi:signal transduction histidine kinase
LNILSGFTQILTTPNLELSEEEKKQLANDIILNTERITGLVNKMLELSDANSRSVIERTDKVTPNKIVSEALVKSMIADKPSLTFDLEIQPEAENIQLNTNLQAAVRALALLLDNARRYTKEGHIRLLVGKKDGVVSFTVEDTGIGVPPNEAEHIFQEFVQLNEYEEGTGIGLTVARSIARRLGGDVVLDTSYTGGARFVMTHPVLQA